MKLLLSIISLFIGALLPWSLGLSAEPPQKALLIIDMQDHFSEPELGEERSIENARKLNEVINHQVQLIEKAKRAQAPILIVEYEDIFGSEKTFGLTNHRLMAAVEGYEKVRVVKKDKNGLFHPENSYYQEAKSQLDSWGVTDLVVVGANGGDCVFETIRGAILNKYRVHAYNGGIADFNSEEFILPYFYTGDFEAIFGENFKNFEQFDDLQEISF